MDRNEYLRALDRALAPLVLREEREEILRYYTEYFDEAGPEGETGVIAELGDPRLLARTTAGGGGLEPLPGNGLLRRLRELPQVGKLFRVSRRTWLRLGAAAVAVALIAVLAGFLRFALPVGKVYTSPAVLTGLEFSAIRLDVACADVDIQPGDKYRVELLWNEGAEYQLRCGVRGGTLVVSGEAAAKTMTKQELNCRVRVTVPRETALVDVDLNVSAGDISVGDLEMDRLSVSTGSGQVKLAYTHASAELTVYTGLGDVTYWGEAARTSSFYSAVGDVTLRLEGPPAACSYDLTAQGPGASVTVNGESKGSAAVFHSEGEKAAVTAGTEKGNVVVTFPAVLRYSFGQ